MPASLTLLDFSDLDLFFAFRDACDDDGWATSAEVASQIGITNERPARCVGSRFAWFRRYGWMETKTERGETLWRTTSKGAELFNPQKLTAATAQALARLDEGQRAQVTNELARAIPLGSREGAHLAVRAFRNGTGGWRDPKLAPKAR